MRNKKSASSISASLKIKQKFSLSAFSSLLIFAGIVSIVKVTQINATLDLHSPPMCAAGVSPYVLDWATVSWTNGSTSTSYSNVDGSGVTLSFNYTGATGKFGSIGSGPTPNIQDFFPSETVDALSHYIGTGFASGESITMSIDISPAIPANIAFDLYHVNGSSFSGDNFQIYAEPSAGGANIYPIFTGNGTSSWEDEGNGVIDAINGDLTGTNAYVGVNFASATYIDKIVLVWSDCDICGNGVHGWGMGNIEFCTSVVDQDGDNILDAVDIDDDNDGIPDIVEVCGTSPTPTTGDITIEIQFDGYASETSWTLKNSAGTTLASGSSYGAGENNTLFTESYNSAPIDAYTFEILDSYGDGLCCANSGYYQVKLDGEIVLGPVTGNFGASSSGTINIVQKSFSCIAGDPSLDSDSDGIINYKDADFCTLNAAGVCASLDKDSDGIPDFLDLDADNDGIPDIVEAGGADADGDGQVDNSADTDLDGLANVFETTDGSTSILFDPNGDGTNENDGDFDGDNIANWLDLDSDDDGITDVRESGGTDVGNDGIIDNFSTDTDDDGFADAVDGDVGNDGTAENSANALVVTSADNNNDAIPDTGYPNANTDGSGNPDYLDIDADDDGIVDNTEAQLTGSYIAPSNTDSDGDGIDDAYDDDDVNFGGSGLDPVNTDNSGNPDYTDTDSDDDLQLDSIEGHDSNGDNIADASSPSNTGVATGFDIDGDGLDDGYDNNTASTDPTNGNLNASNHPIYDGGSDQDWRITVLLPVEWMSFEAVWQGEAGALRWETLQEINSSHFQIQRKIKGQGIFETLGKVEAHGNSTEVQAYQYLDESLNRINKGDKISYRLKQIDIDGQFEFSHIVELTASEEIFKLRVYPNPASNHISIDVNKGYGNQTLKILSVDGRKVFAQEIRDTDRKIELNISSWAKGAYIVQLEDDRMTRSEQLIVK